MTTRPFDKSLFILTTVLSVIGIILIADASAPQALSYFGDSLYFAKQQLAWGVVGFIAMLVASKIPYLFWKKIAIIIFAFNILLLIGVLIPGIGHRVLGAKRWIDLGFFGFQPAEIVKLTLAIYIASLADSGKSFWAMLIAAAGVAGLVMLEPDLGTTLIILAIALIQIFVAGIPLLQLFGSMGMGLVGCLLLILLSDYRRQRLLTFLQSSNDPLGSDYHIRQILIALGSGGLFGVGLGQGRQKFLFLPESATDSIFPVLAEEIGFVGALAIICLFIFFVFKALRIAKNAPDNFSKVLACGIVAWIGGQMFLNISSMVALTPLTGVPLPFFSYGGTSLTMILFGIGILLNISRYAKTPKLKRH